MAPESESDLNAAEGGPDAAGAIVPPRNADGTPARPAADPELEATVTDEAADAIDNEVATGDEVPQPWSYLPAIAGRRLGRTSRS